MNKSGQAIFAGIGIFIVALIALVQMTPIIKDQITDVRQEGNLDCTLANTTVMQKATCVIVDTTLFYYFWIGLSAAAAFLTGKWLTNLRTQ